MEQTRIMAVDYGSVRIGVALSDPLRIIARPFTTIVNRGAETYSELIEIVHQENVGKVIVGLPLNLAGEDSLKTIEVREFTSKLAEVLEVPIEFWDERYSTVEADRILKQMGYTISGSRKVVDKMAAALILKDYLDNLE